MAVAAPLIEAALAGAETEGAATVVAGAGERGLVSRFASGAGKLARSGLQRSGKSILNTLNSRVPLLGKATDLYSKYAAIRDDVKAPAADATPEQKVEFEAKQKQRSAEAEGVKHLDDAKQSSLQVISNQIGEIKDILLDKLGTGSGEGEAKKGGIIGTILGVVGGLLPALLLFANKIPGFSMIKMSAEFLEKQAARFTAIVKKLTGLGGATKAAEDATSGAGEKAAARAGAKASEKAATKVSEKAAEKAVTAASEKVALKAGEKVAAEEGAKAAGKLGAKAIAKQIPLLGLALGLGFGAKRAWDGDWSGAAQEVGSGALATAGGLLAPESGGASLALNAIALGMDANLARQDFQAAQQAERQVASGTPATIEPVAAEAPRPQPIIAPARPAAPPMAMEPGKPKVERPAPITPTPQLPRVARNSHPVMPSTLRVAEARASVMPVFKPAMEPFIQPATKPERMPLIQPVKAAQPIATNVSRALQTTTTTAEQANSAPMIVNLPAPPVATIQAGGMHSNIGQRAPSAPLTVRNPDQLIRAANAHVFSNGMT
jgi:hypothetical protein